ncbi:MAG: PEP-CTERM sorting domain-containing protein [Microcystis sp. LE19-338.1B]|jgi:hypothetical protein|nr:PEP-CTERM sorting domain-containing protein [Microcystis sp. LE19-338.1B]MCZ8358428.1 PEP-CTERM sorting domain-containing protein [Microcystis sp. LE19-388.1G]
MVNGVFQLNYSASPGPNMALTTGGSLSYTVSILPSFTNVFSLAGTNAQGSALSSGDFIKTLAATNLTPNPLNFNSESATVNGTFAPDTKVIDVTSTWIMANPGVSFINSFSDQYTQSPVNPTPIAVPEPSAVLGLVALGLVGVLGRSVSKSLHNK